MKTNWCGHPMREWEVADLPVTDCPRCGAPVIDLPEYGGSAGRVSLDAMPLRTVTLGGFEEPHASLQYPRPDTPHRYPHTEHMVSVGNLASPGGPEREGR